MFESVNALSRRLKQPVWTGDQRDEYQLREQHLANARALRNEAFASIGRALIASLRSVWHRITQPVLTSHSHQS
ncbi:MAG: hypothetical protein AAGA21_07810 [Pseudomonadota bacterium]